MPMNLGRILAIAAFCTTAAVSGAEESSGTLNDCLISLKADSLVVENACMRRVYDWNGGNLSTRSIVNKESGHVWISEENGPDMALPGQSAKAKLISFSVDVVPENRSHEAFLAATVTYSMDELCIRRVIRLYPDCPVVASDFFFKGRPAADWYNAKVLLENVHDIHFVRMGNLRKLLPVMEKVSMPGKHWRYRIVELYEMTDHLNNLVREEDPIGYYERLYRGNLLFAKNEESDQGLFFLKEAQSPNAQLKYMGGDYLAAFGQIRMTGLGLGSEDISPDHWTQGYSAVTGVYDGTEYSALCALKNYQSRLRKHYATRDEMVMMNTWGDRSDPYSALTEKYVLEELDLCARLGISHYQLDYGWQTEVANLPLYGPGPKNNRDNPYYWLPDKVRFPNGFTPIMEKAAKLGIEVCVWFEPNYYDNYERWSNDADWLIRLNRLYGIRTFKVDGLRIHNKLSEVRVDSLFRKVSEALDNDVCINLDVTADRRFGYLYKNSYGNIFLENRYTDWGNYYPYLTLRNLWMLSKYVPAQNLQLEFPNNWRCTDKYSGMFVPASYDFEYLFAITMMAQPLAWMQAHNLPEEGFKIGPVIKNYRKYQADIHDGMIFPIGEEPSGTSWTGFQSVQEGKGYFLVIRERNERENASLKTWLEAGKRVKLTLISGKGKKSFSAKAGHCGEVTFSLPAADSYALYSYEICQ